MVGQLSGILKDSGSVVFVSFRGISVSDTTSMRKELRGKGVGYMVAKKTLAKRTLAEAPIEGSMPDLPGELALVYGEDMLAPAREIYDFQKKYKDSLTILGGIFENRYVGQGDMVAIATIPPVQVLRGQFVRLINSPIQRFAMAVDQIAKKQA
jgi:large subunit ribosomal protein L10